MKQQIRNLIEEMITKHVYSFEPEFIQKTKKKVEKRFNLKDVSIEVYKSFPKGIVYCRYFENGNIEETAVEFTRIDTIEFIPQKLINIKSEMTPEQLDVLTSEIKRTSEIIGIKPIITVEHVFPECHPELLPEACLRTPLEDLLIWSETASRESIINKAKELLSIEKREMKHFFDSRKRLGIRNDDDDKSLFENTFQFRYRSNIVTPKSSEVNIDCRGKEDELSSSSNVFNYE